MYLFSQQNSRSTPIKTSKIHFARCEDSMTFMHDPKLINVVDCVANIVFMDWKIRLKVKEMIPF